MVFFERNHLEALTNFFLGGMQRRHAMTFEINARKFLSECAAMGILLVSTYKVTTYNLRKNASEMTFLGLT